MSKDTDDLRAQVARIKDGDKVRATFEDPADSTLYAIEGIAQEDDCLRLWLGPVIMRYAPNSTPQYDRRPGRNLVSIDSHEPALPPEPPVGSVVVKDGNAYTRFHSHGRRCWGAFGIDEAAVDWAAVADGNVIFTPASGAESVARANAVAARTPRFR